MELSPFWVALLATVIAGVLLLHKLKARSRRVYNLPPGPKRWPVIGNLNLIGALPHRSIDELAKKYGPLMYLRFGSMPVVVGSSVDMAKFFLKTNDLQFLDRPRTAVGKHATYNYADITWAPYGSHWRQARRICATELFSPRRLESSEPIRADEVRALVRGLLAASTSGRPVNLYKDHLSTSNMNVITRMVLGKRFSGEGADAVEGGPVSSLAELKWMLDELMLLSGAFNIGDWIPWLDWLDLQGYVRRMKKLNKIVDAFMEHVLEEPSERLRREGERFVPRNMVDVLMQLADNPTRLEVKLDRVSVKAFTQDIIVGGTETSSSTVEWAMSELLKQQSILAKATEELDRVVGRGRWVTEKDMDHLPYLDAIIKETMRVHPLAPFLSPRIAREDAKVGGYDIPKGTCVFVNMWTITRDTALWDKPEEFSPERFVGSNIDVKGQSYELLPFGAGRRMCPASSLGLKVVQLVLANLLHGFTWSLPEGMTRDELCMDEDLGLLIMSRKFPLQAVVEPRLPAELYA